MGFGFHAKAKLRIKEAQDKEESLKRRSDISGNWRLSIGHPKYPGDITINIEQNGYKISFEGYSPAWNIGRIQGEYVEGILKASKGFVDKRGNVFEDRYQGRVDDEGKIIAGQLILNLYGISGNMSNSYSIKMERIP